ncbi:uncharacterized protein [Medicago truncatula]|uniref:uncharacterized protein n=1 Tax=Medicago truncatula TaxID=3880 RepID=UPI001967EEA5|nr:uncharacterized protein LOC112419438 [Medicago truncatula]
MGFDLEAKGTTKNQKSSLAYLSELSSDTIWKERNNKIWKEVTDAHGYVFDRAKTLLEDWKSAKSIQKVSVSSEQQACITKWMKPSSGLFKCNIDAAFSETTNLVGIGMCIRDEDGHFVLAKTDYFSPTCNVHIGEALGLLSAMDWVHLLQPGTVDFEMDAKRVVDSFNSRQSEATEYGNIIDNCKTLSRQFYENSRVEFVRRQANEVAHSLAKAALSSASSQILVEIPVIMQLSEAVTASNPIPYRNRVRTNEH